MLQILKIFNFQLINTKLLCRCSFSFSRQFIMIHAWNYILVQLERFSFTKIAKVPRSQSGSLTSAKHPQGSKLLLERKNQWTSRVSGLLYIKLWESFRVFPKHRFDEIHLWFIFIFVWARFLFSFCHLHLLGIESKIHQLWVGIVEWEKKIPFREWRNRKWHSCRFSDGLRPPLDDRFPMRFSSFLHPWQPFTAPRAGESILI